MNYVYDQKSGKLFVHYPHITRSFDVEEGIDGKKFVIFDEVEDLDDFITECEELGMNVDYHCFGGWEDNAVALEDLI